MRPANPQQLSGSGADDGFDLVLERSGIDPGDDQALAELIEADGRARLLNGQEVELGRYLSVVADLAGRSEPLDAAIEMALRWFARNGQMDGSAINALVRSYPQLEQAIREADALGNALWSTARLEQSASCLADERDLPIDLGPRTASGQPRYELQRLVGEGAFGQVFMAVDRQLSERDRPAVVAVKVLTTQSRSPLARERLTEEATKARRIDHPNVVRVFDRGITDNGEDYIVYEFMEGGDLTSLVRGQSGVLSLNRAVTLSARIARGLHAAHMAGLVHCDLKPANIMLTADGEPKVADFGIAVREGEEVAERLRPLGNQAFISPEQYRMEAGCLTVPSDIYALGGVLYWLVTRRLPHGSTLAEIQRTHDPEVGRTNPPYLRAARPGIDRDLEAICSRCMARLPADRYGSAQAVADDLEAWLRREPLSWTKPSALRRLWLWSRRKPPMAIAVAVTSLLAATGAITTARWYEELGKRRIEAAQRQASVEHLDAFFQGMMEAKAQGADTDLLPQIWITEWIYGPTVLKGGIDWPAYWKVRTDVVRGIVEKRRLRGQVDDVMTLSWETTQGFWEITERRYETALQTLLRNRYFWVNRAGPDDPVLADIDLMLACARVGLASEAGDGAYGESECRRLDLLRETLEYGHVRLAVEEPGSPVHCMILRSLVQLLEPQLLNDPVGLVLVQADLGAASGESGESDGDEEAEE